MFFKAELGGNLQSCGHAVRDEAQACARQCSKSREIHHMKVFPAPTANITPRIVVNLCTRTFRNRPDGPTDSRERREARSTVELGCFQTNSSTAARVGTPGKRHKSTRFEMPTLFPEPGTLRDLLYLYVADPTIHERKDVIDGKTTNSRRSSTTTPCGTRNAGRIGETT